MPSDPTIRAALDALEAPREAFRSSLVTGVEELRAAVAAGLDASDDAPARAARELGPFASGLVDPARFAAVFRPRERALPEGALEWMERALAVLLEAAYPAADRDSLVVVPAGEDLHDAVAAALARTGRAFGAARVAEGARTGTMVPAAREAALVAYPFRRWAPRERAVAPPLVVEVMGRDLAAAGLGDFMDGGLKLVLVVRGAAPPAALSRLVTPATYVAQATEAAAAAALAARPGPGVVALFEASAGAVPFVHDPLAGRATWERLRLGSDADDLRRRLEDGRGRWRIGAWVQDLEHLLALAAPPAAATAAAEAQAAPADPAERLAAWLLSRSGLDEAPPPPAPVPAEA